jgi:hypothetical protein
MADERARLLRFSSLAKLAAEESRGKISDLEKLLKYLMTKAQ